MSFQKIIQLCTHARIEGRNQLFISMGAIFMNFHKMTSSCLFNHGTTFSQTATDMFFSQHLQIWELISVNQSCN